MYIEVSGCIKNIGSVSYLCFQLISPELVEPTRVQIYAQKKKFKKKRTLNFFAIWYTLFVWALVLVMQTAISTKTIAHALGPLCIISVASSLISYHRCISQQFVSLIYRRAATKIAEQISLSAMI